METCTKCGEAFTAMDWTGSYGLCVKCYFSCPCGGAVHRTPVATCARCGSTWMTRKLAGDIFLASAREGGVKGSGDIFLSVDYKEEQAVARMKRPTERERAKEPLVGVLTGAAGEAHQRTIDRKRTLILTDKLFRFCCGLNMQDHPVAEQRELRDLLRQLGPLLSTKGDR